MEDLKVGDRVESVHDLQMKGEVVRIVDGSLITIAHVRWDSGAVSSIPPERIRRIPEFRVGDHVHWHVWDKDRGLLHGKITSQIGANDYFVDCQTSTSTGRVVHRSRLAHYTPKRCDKCGWPLKERIEDGCTNGNCSQRPIPKNPEPPKPDLIVRVTNASASFDFSRRFFGVSGELPDGIDPQSLFGKRYKLVPIEE